jgi:hypothetical protein
VELFVQPISWDLVGFHVRWYGFFRFDSFDLKFSLSVMVVALVRCPLEF